MVSVLLLLANLVSPADAQRGIAVEAVRSLENDLGGPLYGQSWALIVGINRYPADSPFRSLSFAVNDARAVRDLLVKHYGFPAANVVYLVNEEATRDAILKAFMRLVGQTGEDDRLVFYYSGHGHTAELRMGGKRGFLVPAKVSLKENELRNGGRLEATCVSMQRLKDLANAAAARHVLFLMDACYSGLAISGRSTREVPYNLRRIVVRPMRAVVTAGQAGEEAFEDPEVGHGYFTKKLLDGLEVVHGTILADTQPAEKSDGVVTLKELSSYLVSGVSRISHGRQNPQESQEGEGQFLFIPQVEAQPKPEPPVVAPVATTATIEVTSTPPGAEVFVDDHLKGRTPCNLTVEVGAGTRTVEVIVQQQGYRLKGGRLTVRRGQRVPWEVVLERLPKPTVRPTPPRVRPQPGTIGQTRINPVDGAEMVYVPGGTFTMGSNDGGEKPPHQVSVPGFWMYKCEVTVAQYRKFCQETGRQMPEEPSWKWQDDHPVVNVSWEDAQAYSKWAQARLPTEAEWEHAARGGNQFEHGTATGELSHDLANYHGTDGKDTWEFTSPVGSFPPNPFGLCDMAGNVWEWCQDWFGDYPSGAVSDPAGPNTGGFRVVRGGSWGLNAARCRAATRLRNRPTLCNLSLGFRPVLAPPGQPKGSVQVR